MDEDSIALERYQLNTKQRDLQVVFASAVENLRVSLRLLEALIQQTPNDYPVWMRSERGMPNPSLARCQIVSLYSKLEHVDDGKVEYLQGNETETLYGVMAVTPETLKQALQVNECKARVRELVMLANKKQITVDDPQNPRTTRTPFLKYLLRVVGLARLHKQQLYRRIPVLEATPKSISLGWAYTRSVARTSREDVLTLLQEVLCSREAYKVKSRDYLRIKALPEAYPLARVEPARFHARANVVLADVDGYKQKNKQIPIAMPLLYPLESLDQKPRFSPMPYDTPDPNCRLTRTDKRLEEEPMIPAFNIYRYQDEERLRAQCR